MTRALVTAPVLLLTNLLGPLGLLAYLLLGPRWPVPAAAFAVGPAA